MTEIAIIQGICELAYGSSRRIQILSKFLLYDVGTIDPTSTLDWINNNEHNSMILNYSYLVKTSDKIRIYFFYDGYGREENEKRDMFEIKKEALINVISKWTTAHRELIPITIITIDGDEIKLNQQKFNKK